jgi:hypothetical protein
MISAGYVLSVACLQGTGVSGGMGGGIGPGSGGTLSAPGPGSG